MTEEEKELMESYGITVEQKSVYFYKGHTYENLKDALNYAKIDAKRTHELPASNVEPRVIRNDT